MSNKGAIVSTVWVGGQKSPIHLTICYMTSCHTQALQLAINYAKQTGLFGRNNQWNITFLQWGKNSDLVVGINSAGVQLQTVVDQMFALINSQYSAFISKSRYPTGQPPLHADVSMLPVRPTGQTWTCTLSVE